jgi:hypothetical protein
MALVAQTEAQGTKARRKSQASRAGNGQGDHGRGFRRPALRRGRDDTAEAGEEELERANLPPSNSRYC